MDDRIKVCCSWKCLTLRIEGVSKFPDLRVPRYIFARIIAQLLTALVANEHGLSAGGPKNCFAGGGKMCSACSSQHPRGVTGNFKAHHLHRGHERLAFGGAFSRLVPWLSREWRWQPLGPTVGHDAGWSCPLPPWEFRWCWCCVRWAPTRCANKQDGPQSPRCVGPGELPSIDEESTATALVCLVWNMRKDFKTPGLDSWDDSAMFPAEHLLCIGSSSVKVTMALCPGSWVCCGAWKRNWQRLEKRRLWRPDIGVLSCPILQNAWVKHSDRRRWNTSFASWIAAAVIHNSPRSHRTGKKGVTTRNAWGFSAKKWSEIQLGLIQLFCFSQFFPQFLIKPLGKTVTGWGHRMLKEPIQEQLFRLLCVLPSRLDPLGLRWLGWPLPNELRSKFEKRPRQREVK